MSEASISIDKFQIGWGVIIVALFFFFGTLAAVAGELTFQYNLEYPRF